MVSVTEEEYYSLLRGMKIIDTYMVDAGDCYDQPFPCLVLENLIGDRFRMLVCRDPEQNGPGFLVWDQVPE